MSPIRYLFAASTIVAAVTTSAQHTPSAEELAKKEPNSVEARRALTNSVYQQRRMPTVPALGTVIYGDDDRIEVWQETDPQIRAMAEAACVVVFRSELSDNGDGTFDLSTSPWTFQSGSTICEDEPFRGQANIGFCSGFLVNESIVVTAGHCVDAGDVSSVAFVFGFQIEENGGSAPVTVPASHVAFPSGIINQQLAGDFDHSVVQLSAPITDIQPVPVRREGVVPNGARLAAIGHPSTLPKKIAGGAVVQDNLGTTPFVQANLDTYGGNSGSMVVNLDEYIVEGILVRGAPDFTSGPGGCTQSNRVPDTGSPTGLEFEEVSKTITFAGDIPPIGLSASITGNTLHYGNIGGPFTSPTFSYTLRNPTSEPISYQISQSGDAFISITSPASGAIPADSELIIDAELSSQASAAAAGLYQATITISDLTNARDISSTHTLEVGQSLVDITGGDIVASGPIGGPFIGQASYDFESQRPTPTTIAISSDQSWLDHPASVSLGSTGDTTQATIAVNSSASSLPAGLYNATITFEDLTTGAITTRSASLDVGRFVIPAQDLPLDITDNNTIESTLSVADQLCVSDVEVDVNIQHTFRGDLIVELISPSGTTVRLHNRTGGSASDLVLRYGANDTPPSGPGSLEDFDNEFATGDWTLRISDNANADTGQLLDWALRIASSGDECPPQALSASYALVPGELKLIELEAASTGPVTFQIHSLPQFGVLWDNSKPESPTPITSAPISIERNELLFRATPGEAGATSFDFSAMSGSGLISETESIDIEIGGLAPAYAETLDAQPAGWSLEGAWGFGQPAGIDGDPDAGFTGNNVYGFNLNGEYANNISQTQYLTSAPFDIDGLSGLALRFQRLLGIESSTYDDANIQYALDGGPWQNIWVHSGGTLEETEWSQQTYDLSAELDGGSSVRFRWGLGPTDISVTFQGWNLDDIEVLALSSGGNPADVAEPAGIDFLDYVAFFASFASGQPIADFDGDAAFTNADVNTFIDAANANN